MLVKAFSDALEKNLGSICVRLSASNKMDDTASGKELKHSLLKVCE